jgi:uncharacterized protein YjbJ (UPF0337 family)
LGELEDKLSGNIKEKGGELTGDKKTEFEGKGQKLKGDLEGAGNKAKEGMEEPSTDETA